MPRLICTRGRAITNDWTISMARSIVGNHATTGSDQRPIVGSDRPTIVGLTMVASGMRLCDY